MNEASEAGRQDHAGRGRGRPGVEELEGDLAAELRVVGSKDLPLTLAAKIARHLQVPLGALVSDIDDGETEECHRVCLRLCRMVRETGHSAQWVGEWMERVLSAILAFVGKRAL